MANGATGLAAPIQQIAGVGPKLAARFANLQLHTVQDLFWHLPARYIDRRLIDTTGHVQPGEERTVVGIVQSSRVTYTGRAKRRVYEVVIDDGSGPMQAVWFNFREQFLQRQFPIGRRVMLAGDCLRMGHAISFLHPEVELLPDDPSPGGAWPALQSGGKLLPVYPATEGLSQRLFRRTLQAAWQQWGDAVADPLPPAVRQRCELLSLHDAFFQIHFPDAAADVALLDAKQSPSHQTLKMIEALLCALALGLRQHERAHHGATAVVWNDAIAAQVLADAGFVLTAAQQRVLREIAADSARDVPMYRLVQGDVGSGKTIVAGIAAAQVVAAGGQAVLLAPTELLAQQHLRNLSRVLATVGCAPAVLTGATPAKERAQLLEQLATGARGFVIGTHALLESDVVFARLQLAIVDEQHRFGVAQRLTLQQKGTMPHVLVLTATPIPRTLAMTLYGDLTVSIIDELPAGRKPVITRLYREHERPRLYQGMQAELARGHQIYVVYPLVAESEKVDLRDATAMSEQLRAQCAPQWTVGLLHGRMSPDEKDRVMREFAAGTIHVLVTTTVVEVGVDVPNATVMIVEHAERFGLAQLHQLRGRVGRSDRQSYCVLVASPRLTDDGYARLSVLTRTTDGFAIAEEDLRLRGPGEVLGTRQSGLPSFRVLDLVEDLAILNRATQYAGEILRDDPGLQQHSALRTAVLQQFGTQLPLASVG